MREFNVLYRIYFDSDVTDQEVADFILKQTIDLDGVEAITWGPVITVEEEG